MGDKVGAPPSDRAGGADAPEPRAESQPSGRSSTGAEHTPGPWELCHHLMSMEADAGCSCGYRGVIFGPDRDVPMAICQPGHDAEPVGQEGLGPVRYPREVELANARLIAASPDMLADLDWYADQLCEGWCLGAPERAGFSDDNCSGCRARRGAAKARGLPCAAIAKAEGR